MLDCSTNAADGGVARDGVAAAGGVCFVATGGALPAGSLLVGRGDVASGDAGDAVGDTVGDMVGAIGDATCDVPHPDNAIPMKQAAARNPPKGNES